MADSPALQAFMERAKRLNVAPAHVAPGYGMVRVTRSSSGWEADSTYLNEMDRLINPPIVFPDFKPGGICWADRIVDPPYQNFTTTGFLT